MAYKAIRNNQGQQTNNQNQNENKPQSKDERNIQNNAKNIKNAADVAMKSKNPYAMAAGAAVKAADKLTGGKSTQALGKAMNKANKMTPGGKMLQNASNKLSESGASDKIGKAASMAPGKSGASSAPNGTGGAPNGAGNTNGNTPNPSGSSPNSSGENSNNGNNKPNESHLPNPLGMGNKKGGLGSLFGSDDKDSSGIASISGLMSFKKKLMLYGIIGGVAFFFLLIFGLVTIFSSTTSDAAEKEDENGNCTYTSTADASSKMKIRTTTYYCQGPDNFENCSLSAVGNVNNLIKKGYITFDSFGYAIWKGGTYNFGEKGVDYLIAATAQESLVGKFGYNRNDQIHYYQNGDTFSIETTFKGQKVNYNTIVLDACGACMSWSTTSKDKYSPSTEAQIKYAKNTNNTKIDFFTSKNKITATSDVAYMMNGITNNVCVGEVDLGNLVTGIDDTRLLEGKSITDVYGASGINELNNQITNNVNEYGSGTGKGVAAAAITLINSLKDKGYRLPYYWAGGHGAISTGVKNSWGNSTNSSCSPGRCYYYDSLDCSGFVSWAIKNGGCSNFTSRTSKLFGNIGPKENLSNVKAGDILVHPGSHVVLVVQNNAGKIILAESSGGVGGVHFTDYNSSSYSNNPNYYFIDMSSFYSSNSCK